MFFVLFPNGVFNRTPNVSETIMFRNVTQVHVNFPDFFGSSYPNVSRPRIAFESDLQGSGCWKYCDTISLVYITKSTKMYKNFQD